MNTQSLLLNMPGVGAEYGTILPGEALPEVFPSEFPDIRMDGDEDEEDEFFDDDDYEDDDLEDDDEALEDEGEAVEEGEDLDDEEEEDDDF